jgi:pimeloyl-ACP methyl ester carboxylesterase
MQRFDTRDGNYQIEFYDGSDVLWITFDHAGLPRNPIGERNGWGAVPLLKLGVSVICIKARHRCWYTRSDAIDFFHSDWFQAQCKGKKRIILYGLSMGGFAALVYSSFIPKSVVLALCPQTTLNVPWENRPHEVLDEDWAGPYSDLNNVSAAYSHAYVIYSRGNAKDKKHVDRMADHHSVISLEMAGSSHHPIGPLIEVGNMSKILRSISEGRFSKDYFNSLAPFLENSQTEHLNRAEDSPDKAFRDVSFARARELSTPKGLPKLDQKIIQCRLQWAVKEDDIDTVTGIVNDICANTALHSSTGLVMFAVRKSLLLKQTYLAQTALDTLLSSPNLNAKMREKIDALLSKNSHLHGPHPT